MGEAQPKPNPYTPIFEKLPETELLARCLFGEARGEPAIGKLAVAHVILNRAAKPSWWGGNIREVILKPMQFSCFKPGDPNSVILAAIKNNVVYSGLPECRAVADLALAGLTIDPTGGALHYHEEHILPAWASKLAERSRSDTTFFTGKPDLRLPRERKGEELWAGYR